MSEPKRAPEDEQDEMFEFLSTAPVLPTSLENRPAWSFYVNGYKDAADLLVAHAAEGDPRKLGYPIVFLYRQHLELALNSDV